MSNILTAEEINKIKISNRFKCIDPTYPLLEAQAAKERKAVEGEQETAFLKQRGFWCKRVEEVKREVAEKMIKDNATRCAGYLKAQAEEIKRGLEEKGVADECYDRGQAFFEKYGITTGRSGRNEPEASKG